MSGLRYLHATDDWMAVVGLDAPGNITGTGTVDPDYPVANVGDRDPANPFKTPDLTVNIDLDLGSATAIGLVAIVHANLDPGLSGVHLLGSTSNTFASGFTSEAIVIPTYQPDGHPTSALLTFAPQSYRYWRLAITTPNSVGLSLGELVLASGWRTLTADLQMGATDEDGYPTIENESDAGGVTTVYEHLVRRRWLRGTFRLDVVDLDAMRDWHRGSRGRGLPFLIHPTLPTDEPWYVRWEKTSLTRARPYQNVDDGSFLHDWAVGFEECARGLAPEPASTGA